MTVMTVNWRQFNFGFNDIWTESNPLRISPMDLSTWILWATFYSNKTPTMLCNTSFIRSVTRERSELVISGRHIIVCGFTSVLEQETQTLQCGMLRHWLLHFLQASSMLTWTLTGSSSTAAAAVERAASAAPARQLTSSCSGEDFDACRWGTGRGPEDAAEAQAAGRLGRGVLMRRIGEDGFGQCWAALGLNWRRQWTARQGRALRRRDPLDGAGWTDASLSLQNGKQCSFTPGN